MRFFLFLLVIGQAYGQSTNFLRDYTETRGFMLGRPTRAMPTPDGKAVLFLRSPARTPVLSLYEFDIATGQTRELLKGSEDKLTPEEKARRERQRMSLAGFTNFQLSPGGTQVLLSSSGKIYLLNRVTRQVQRLATGPGVVLDPQFSPDSKSVSYVRNNDVYAYNLSTHQEHPVTTGGSAEKTHGLAEFVAQEEMARFSGYAWSPDSRFIIYEEADYKGVEILYVADPAKPAQPPQPFYYPRPGQKNVTVHLGVVSVSGGKTTWIRWNAKDYPYVAQVHWDKIGPLTLIVQSRLQQNLALLKADPATGKTANLLTQTDPTWINLHQDTPKWLPYQKGFLWTSDSAPGPRLELRSVTGRLKKVLVPSSLRYRHLVSTDYYLASTDSRALELYGLSDPKPLGVVAAQNGAVFSKDQSVYVLTSSSSTQMPRVTVHKADGTLIGELPSVAESPGFIPNVQFEDSAAMVRPKDFDSKKKYPVIVDVYGGPGHNHVVLSMRNWLLDQWLADQGFIIVAIENRGTPGRGHAWERALYKNFASVPLDDQVAGLQALGKKFPELDLNRVGIFGWSFGGYLAALAVLKRPDIFKAAVAGAPVSDWEDYDTHYTERYLGFPKDNPKVYQEASLLTYADKLERPLLLVHGTHDDNVYFKHTLKLTEVLFKAGKRFELLPLVGQTHMVSDPAVMQQLWIRTAQFFQETLLSR